MFYSIASDMRYKWIFYFYLNIYYRSEELLEYSVQNNSPQNTFVEDLCNLPVDVSSLVY